MRAQQVVGQTRDLLAEHNRSAVDVCAVERPRVSLVVPCKGRLHHLHESLPSMLAQRCTFEFEVVVVDFGCPQGTFEWCRSLDLRQLVAVKVLDDTAEFQRSRSRNCGARFTRGKFLAFVDADIIPADSWLETASLPLRSGQADYCTVADGFQTGWDRGGTWLVAANLFHEVGGYDEALRGWGLEDDDLYRRVAILAREAKYPSDLLHPIRHGEAERVRFHEQKGIAASSSQNQDYLAQRRGRVNPEGYGLGRFDIFRGQRKELPQIRWIERPRIVRRIRQAGVSQDVRRFSEVTQARSPQDLSPREPPEVRGSTTVARIDAQIHLSSRTEIDRADRA